MPCGTCGSYDEECACVALAEELQALDGYCIERSRRLDAWIMERQYRQACIDYWLRSEPPNVAH